MQTQDLMANVKMMYIFSLMSLLIYGEIPDFNRKISTVRSRGIALIPIVQNIRTNKKSLPYGYLARDNWQL